MNAIKSYLFGFLIVAEAIVIVFLFHQNFQVKKQNFTLQLEIKGQKEKMVEQEASLQELKLRIAEAEEKRNDVESQVEGLRQENIILTAKLEGLRNVREDFLEYFRNQQENMLQQINAIARSNESQLSLFFDKMDTFKQPPRTSASHQVPSRLMEEEKEPAVSESASLPGINLDKIVVEKNKKEPHQQPLLKGNVLKVDYQFDLVVVDVGEKEGATPDMQFFVLRGRKRIGKIALKEVYPNMSIGEPVIEEIPFRVRRGDKVIFFKEG